MANGAKKKQVRHYISDADSAYVLDFLEGYLNRPDVHEVYSKNVAGMPVIEGSEEEWPYYEGDKGGLRGQYSQRDDVIMINQDFEPGWTRPTAYSGIIDRPLKEGGTWTEPRNTMIHEALGHALMKYLYGYHQKPHWTRNEVFPSFIQGKSNIPYMESEEFTKYGKRGKDISMKRHEAELDILNDWIQKNMIKHINEYNQQELNK